MAEKRELEYRDSFVLYLLQTLSDRFDAESDFPALPFTDLTTRHTLTIDVNQREYTQILSAIMTGADLAFPDIAHELELIWTYAREQDVSDHTAVGIVSFWSGYAATIPDKWQVADGHILNVDDYPELYAALPHDIYDNGNGTFDVPDLRSQFLYGAGVDENVADEGGEASVTLTIAQLPAHTHTIAKASAQASQNARAPQGNNTALADQNTGSAGSGEGHNNLPPYFRGFWIIKVLP